MGGLRCVYCHDGFRDEALVTCPDCGTLVHEECQTGRCPTLGCESDRPWRHLKPPPRRTGGAERALVGVAGVLGGFLIGILGSWIHHERTIASAEPQRIPLPQRAATSSAREAVVSCCHGRRSPTAAPPDPEPAPLESEPSLAPQPRVCEPLEVLPGIVARSPRASARAPAPTRGGAVTALFSEHAAALGEHCCNFYGNEVWCQQPLDGRRTQARSYRLPPGSTTCAPGSAPWPDLLEVEAVAEDVLVRVPAGTFRCRFVSGATVDGGFASYYRHPTLPLPVQAFVRRSSGEETHRVLERLVLPPQLELSREAAPSERAPASPGPRPDPGPARAR